MKTRWRAFSQFVAGSALWLALAGFLAAAQPNAAAKTPKEFVLIEPSAINPKAVAAWKKEGFRGVAVLTQDSIGAKVYRAAAKAVNQGGLELFYWLEVGRNPRLAAEHPEWTASLGTHNDWRNRFPNAKQPGKDQVAKAFPWVPIHYRDAFDAHLERINRLLGIIPADYGGVLLNDLQGGPASCGCGNLQCRWATDYGVPATATKFDGNDAAARFVAAIQHKVGQKEVVPVWATECDDEDLPRAKRAGEWTTGYSGTVGCAVGRCPKDFTLQWSALTKAHPGRVGLLALHRELGRALPEYGEPTSWVRRAVDYLDRTLPKNGGQMMPHDRLWLVVQGYGVSEDEERAARATAARTGVAVVLVARTRLDQSYEPRIVPVGKVTKAE